MAPNDMDELRVLKLALPFKTPLPPGFSSVSQIVLS